MPFDLIFACVKGLRRTNRMQSRLHTFLKKERDAYSSVYMYNPYAVKSEKGIFMLRPPPTWRLSQHHHLWKLMKPELREHLPSVIKGQAGGDKRGNMENA